MLFTIGYEGAALDDFVASLVAKKIKVLIDVRERAQSRRKGFSKTALSQALAESGIDYLHLRELGDPKEGREAARTGKYPEFRRIYANVLRRKDAQTAIETIVSTAKKRKSCLLCYEKDADTCHRKIISDKIFRDTNIDTEHLAVSNNESPISTKRRVLHSGEGASAQV